MSDLLNQASLVMVPSGYKEDTVYSVVPSDGSGDLSFTRASNGTRINSAGLVEVCPWNLVTYSNDFSSNWSLVATSKSTGVTDPIGNSNAIKLKYTTATSGHFTNQVISLTGSNAHSVYAKAGELQFLQIASAQSVDEYANFNLSTGAIGTYGSLASNVQIENVGNGWYRCSVVFTNGSNGIYLAIVQSASSNWFGISTYAGANSTDGLYLYGGQVNAGALKPYFPTTDRLNVPRLTYQNGGGGCPSLLLEKQSTNYLKYSEQFEESYWTKAQGNGGSLPIITANYGISPDGTQNADRVELTRTTQTSSFSYVYQTYSGTIGVAYTWSVWLKSLSGTPSVALSYDGSSYVNIVTLTTEWQRYTFTSNAINTDLQATFLLFQNLSSTSLSADFLAWGAQLEQSSYATSYIPTTSSSATRVADACFKTGISSLIGQTEGTVFLDFVFTNINTVQVVMSLHDNANNKRIEIWADASTLYGFVGGSSSFNIASITATSGARYKVAVAYKSGDSAYYVNGSQIGTNSTTFTISLTSLIFDYWGGAYPPNAKVNEAIIFKTRLTNAELASLTTI